MSEEQRQKIAYAHRGMKPSPKTKLKQSLAKKGKAPWNKGVPMSEESKAKVSTSKKGTPAWNRGKKMSEAMREKMRGNKNGSSNRGRSMSPEWLEKLSNAKKGKPSNAKGRKASQEQRIQMSIKRRNYFKRINFAYSFQEKDVLRRDRKAVRRERIIKNGGFHSNGEWEDLKTKHTFSCAMCGRKDPEIVLTRDHFIAVSLGGSDNIENIQPLCKSCNSIKGTTAYKLL